jgi:hypothetical protein
MSSDDEEAARNARAKELRRHIRKLAGDKAALDQPERPDAAPEAPRDFVHRRMRELKRNQDS